MTRNDVVKLYIAMFDRAPEAEAVNSWYEEAVKNNWSLADLANNMINSAIQVVNQAGLTDLYPQYANVNPHEYNSVKSVIEEVYKTLFNKDYHDDPSGIDAWVNQVISGKQSLGEAIASIEYIAEGIANGSIDLSEYGYSPEDIQKTLEAATAFENKVKAANDISLVIPDIDPNNIKEALSVLQESIENINADEESVKQVFDYIDNNLDKIVAPEYKNQVEEMHQLIEKLKNGEDIKPVIPVVDVDLSQNSFTDENVRNNNLTDYSSTDYDVYDNEDSYLVDYFKSLPKPLFAQLIELEKETLKKEINVVNKYNTITADMLEKIVQIDSDYEHQVKSLFDQYGMDYEESEVYPNYSILEQDPQTLQQIFNTSKSYLNMELDALNKVDPDNPESMLGFVKLTEKADASLEQISGNYDLVYYDYDENDFTDGYDYYGDYDYDNDGNYAYNNYENDLGYLDYNDQKLINLSQKAADEMNNADITAVMKLSNDLENSNIYNELNNGQYCQALKDEAAIYQQDGFVNYANYLNYVVEHYCDGMV